MIAIEGVSKSYPRTGSAAPILTVQSFQVKAGERLALVGASGSGKTTLLNLLGGLVLPDHGSIRVDGTEITGLSEPARDRFRARKIGYLFQGLHLLEGFSALENVELGASFTGRPVDRPHARQLLEAVGLGDRQDHMPGELSMGQQSRVALARALINRPKVLLADEPTGSLDLDTGKMVLDLLLQTTAQEGITLVCATHDPDVAGALDRIARVEDLS